MATAAAQQTTIHQPAMVPEKPNHTLLWTAGIIVAIIIALIGMYAVQKRNGR